MMPFSQYAQIKDYYCICYFGHSDEYLLQLKLLKPIFEREYPGLKIHFGCRDDKTHIFDSNDQVLKVSDIRARRSEFAHIRELRYNGQTHPIEDLVVEAGIKNLTVRTGFEPEPTGRCVIITRGAHPTKPLEKRQVEMATKIAREAGFEVEIDADIKTAGWVIGVESLPLFEAASLGKRTHLVPTGVGTRLYKLFFPKAEVLHK